MGVSTVLAHAILTIVALSLAATFAVAVLFRTYDVSNMLSELVSVKSANIRTEVIISYIGERNLSGTGYIYDIYAKNVGKENILDINRSDLYLGTYKGSLTFYTYNISGGVGHWNFTEYGVDNGIWEPGETIVFHVYTSSKIDPPIEVRLTLPSGVIVKEVSPLS